MFDVTQRRGVRTMRNNAPIVISVIDEVVVRETGEGWGASARWTHVEVILQVETWRPPRFFLRLSSFHNSLLLFPLTVVLGPLSLRLRLSRILTVMRSRIISVIIAQPDVESVAHIFSMYNQWFLLFSSLLRMILLCFRRSRNFVAAPTGSSGSRRKFAICARVVSANIYSKW